MMALIIVFYLFLGLFGVIGSMRGWAKEILVSYSVILALALITVLEQYTPFVRDIMATDPVAQFWIKVSSLLVITFFGYQSPRISRLSKATERRDKFQDILLGLILGFVSGFMFIGTLWYYSAQAGYFPIANYITQPNTPELAASTERIFQILPPQWLAVSPNIFIAMVIGAIIVIVVFV